MLRSKARGLRRELTWLPVSLLLLLAASAWGQDYLVDDSPLPTYANSSNNSWAVGKKYGIVMNATLTVTTTPLNPYKAYLDNQLFGNFLASDGKVYAGSSTHSTVAAAIFFQYNPATAAITILSNDLSTTCHESVTTNTPQGKVHMLMSEYQGRIYFSVHEAVYTPTGYIHWTGSHVLSYGLGSIEAGAADWRDFGVITTNQTDYSALAIDPVHNYIYVPTTRWWSADGNAGSGGTLVRYNADATGTGKTTLLADSSNFGDTWCVFADGRGDMWTSESSHNGTLYKIDGSTGVVHTYANALPLPMNLTSNTVGPDNGQRFFGFGWKLDANHCLVSMGGDGGMWQFDAAAFEAGDPNHGFKLVKWIGAHGGGMTVAGNIVYFVQSADPNWTGGSKAYDHHMKSFDLSNPTAPVVDYGRIVDQAGRTPYRIEGMSADTHGHLYLSGDWRVNPNANSANTPGEPADPNTYMSLRQRYGTTGSYVYLWRGQFFGTVSVASNQAPVVNAGPNAKVMIPNALTLAGTVSDDGLPNPPGVCTIAWSTLSGPGTVSFANASLPGTTATFSTAGTYVLKLTANDSALTGTSNVTVTALAPGDFNGDGKVDGVDFLIWQSHYPTASGATPDGGDANGDGKVDGVDFLVWQANYRG